MTMHRYFARRYLTTFLSVLAVFALLQMLVDMVEELGRLEDGLSYAQVLQLTLLRMPGNLYELVPLVVILSTIGLFLSLARSSELVVARATGRSGLAALAGPATVAALVGVVSVTLVNPIVAATSARYADLREIYESGGASSLSIGSEGLWLRQGGPQGQAVIHAARADADATRLFDVSIVTYAAGGGPRLRILAPEAVLSDGAWQLRDARIWPLTPGLNPEAGRRDHPLYALRSDLTAEGIRDRFGRPADVPVWDLPAFIVDLQAAGFSARRHQVWFHMEIARPVFFVSLLMVGAALTMRPARGARTGILVLAAVMLGFGLYYLRTVAQIMGESGQLTPLVAAWVPPVASLLLALGLVLQSEDG